MDLETENRLAALLMEEARSLRLQAEKEGVHMYLRKPNVRVCPNSRFLTATVLGVQQANRAVEVSEMWHAREKELELDAKLKSRAKGKSICMGGMQHGDASRVSSRPEETGGNSGICSSSNHGYEECYSSDNGGLRDEEVEEFLLSRAKRGRGAIGSRMHEPHMPFTSSDHNGQHIVDVDTRVEEQWEQHILHPEKQSFVNLPKYAAGDAKTKIIGSSKEHRRPPEERRSKKEKKSRKTKRKEKNSKHQHKRRLE